MSHVGKQDHLLRTGERGEVRALGRHKAKWATFMPSEFIKSHCASGYCNVATVEVVHTQDTIKSASVRH